MEKGFFTAFLTKKGIVEYLLFAASHVVLTVQLGIEIGHLIVKVCKQSLANKMSKLNLIHTLSGHKGKVWCAAWSPSGKAVATCGEDKSIRIWQEEGDRWVTKTILSDGHSR